MSEVPVAPMFGERLARAAALIETLGEAEAKAQILARETERERHQMSPLITRMPLARAFETAIPVFQGLGMKMSAVDASNGTRDAVLEIHRLCPYAETARALGIQRPCSLACELDIQAVVRAFPGISGRMLSAQADGDALCIFKYERERPSAYDAATEAQPRAS